MPHEPPGNLAVPFHRCLGPTPLLLLALAAVGAGATALVGSDDGKSSGEPVVRELAPARRLGPREHFDHAGLSTFAIAGECRHTVASAGETVRVWDVASGRLKCEIDPRLGRIGSLVLDGMDGNAYTMAAASRDKPGITVWYIMAELAKPSKLKEYGAGEEGVAVLCATGDGLAAGAVALKGKAVIRLWGTPWVWSGLHNGDVKLRRTFEGHTGTIVALSSYKDWLASAAEDGTVRLWQISTGKELKKWEKGSVAALAFSPQGRFLAVAADKSIHVLDMPDGKEVLEIKGPGGRMTSLGFTKNCASLAAADDTQTLIKWKLTRQLADGTSANDPESKTDPRARLKAEEIGRVAGGGRQLVINAYGEMVASAGADRLRLWQPTDELTEVVPERGEHQTGVTALAFTADGKGLVSQANGVTLWDVATGKPLRRQQTGEGFLAFTPDGQHFLRRGEEKTIRLVELASGKEMRKFAGPSSTVVLSPGGKYALLLGVDFADRPPFASADEQAPASPSRIYELATGKEVASLPGARGLRALAPNGRLLAQEVVTRAKGEGPGAADKGPGAHQHGLALLDPKPKELWRWNVGQAGVTPARVEFSPDGRTLAAGSVLLEVETGKVRVETGANVPQLAFSPDGRLLAATGDHLLHIYNTATGKECFRLTGHKGTITGLAFSQDGRTLASGSEDTTVLLWDLGK